LPASHGVCNVTGFCPGVPPPASSCHSDGPGPAAEIEQPASSSASCRAMCTLSRPLLARRATYTEGPRATARQVPIPQRATVTTSRIMTTAPEPAWQAHSESRSLRSGWLRGSQARRIRPTPARGAAASGTQAQWGRTPEGPDGPAPTRAPRSCCWRPAARGAAAGGPGFAAALARKGSAS
jgi:hypothetical protein